MGQNTEKTYRVLIVEDDRPLADGLCRALQNDRTKTVSCATLREAEALLNKSGCLSGEKSESGGSGSAGEPETETGKQDEFALVVLDVNLPDGNGFDFLQKIKKESDINVIMLTANDMETDIVAGLEMGADDYITKPFSLAVLRARVAAQLRRVEARKERAQDDWFVDGIYRFHFPQMIFMCGKEQVELSKGEQKLLRMLVENRGITLTREQLIDGIWSVDAEFVDENTLSVTVKRLRDKLGAQEKIKTIYGIGYRWE